jgi:hypothetical protein
MKKVNFFSWYGKKMTIAVESYVVLPRKGRNLMMKKQALWIAALAVALSVGPGAALAKSDNGNNGHWGGSSVSGTADVSVNAGHSQSGQEHGGDQAGKDGDSASATATVTGNTYSTVTGSTYGEEHGHNGYRGLLNAIENVKDKPAGAVLADLLLTKYDAKLTDAQKMELSDIIAKDEALSKAAELLDEQGSVTDAVYVQKEAIQANVENVELYKQLGKYYEKLGRTGVKLYVNGDEPATEVAPFIRDGSTLVPFRAIAEALKAEVSWNPDERSVTVTRDGITVKLLIDSKTAYVNGQEVELEVPAAIKDGSTVVPVRFASEALKATVKWEGETQSVIIYEDQ